MSNTTLNSHTRTNANTLPTSWKMLVTSTAHSLRPIKNDSEHEKAMKVLEDLAGLPKMSKDQSDYFEVLSDLVVKYETQRWPLNTSNVSVIDILKSFMEDHNMNASDLGRLIGNDRTLGHKILTKKRKLTTEQIKILADTFKVSTDLFIE